MAESTTVSLKFPKRDILRECRQFINDLFVSNSGEGMKFIERIQYILDPKSLNFDIKRHILTEEAFSYKYENLAKSMNRTIEESKFNNDSLLRYFKAESIIQVNQKLDSINELEKLNVIGKNAKLTIEEGKIYLIYIWSIYKPICKKQLSQLDKIFKEHNWESNAVFVTINTDKNREYSQKLIKMLHCEYFENYYIDENKFPNHPIFNVAKKYGYPASILVNNDGIIELVGSLFEINLEEKIESLLKRERANKNGISNNDFLDENSLKILKKLSRNQLQKRLSEKVLNVNANHLYGATLKIKYIFKSNKNNDFLSDEKRIKIKREILAELDYYAHTSDMKIFDYIFEGMDKIPNLKFNRNIVETFEVPYSRDPICCMCKNSCIESFNDYISKENFIVFNKNDNDEKKERKNNNNKNNNLNDSISYEFSNDEDEIFTANNYFGFYYCTTCNNNYCYKCGESITDLQKINNIHKHFLLYISTENRIFSKFILLYNIKANHDLDFKYFYENSKTEKLVEIASHFMVKCDGCLQFPIRSIRWKCCNCVSKNLCDKCRKKILTRENGYEDLLWNLHHVGCDPIQHVFMKILFDCFAY